MLPTSFRVLLGPAAILLSSLSIEGKCRAQAPNLDSISEEKRPLTLAGGAHLSYGLGGAFAPRGSRAGFRHHIELAAVIGPAWEKVTPAGVPNKLSGLLFGGSALVGLGASPSYALADLGYGKSPGYTAAGAFLEVGTRLGSTNPIVVGVRGNLDVLLANLGVRILVGLEERPELALWITLGLGRY